MSYWTTIAAASRTGGSGCWMETPRIPSRRLMGRDRGTLGAALRGAFKGKKWENSEPRLRSTLLTTISAGFTVRSRQPRTWRRG